MLKFASTHLSQYFGRNGSIAPLVVFRVLFGLSLLYSAVRFLALGWITEQYINPKFHFTYYGFEWVKPLDAVGMYMLYALLIVSALFIAVGLLYRWACVIHFFAFTYIELIDKTYYLNHYYFVSLVCLLLIVLPANQSFSIDNILKIAPKVSKIPIWMIDVLKLQLGIVYFYAGIAKINTDWLINAMPLRIWLSANDHMPLLGSLFRYEITAYIFSWGGMIYDICIPFLMLNRKIRPFAFIFLLFFHGVTGWLFQIGVFPLVMSSAAIIFFDPKFHQNLIDKANNLFKLTIFNTPLVVIKSSKPPQKSNGYLVILMFIFFTIQLLLPWRYLLYPGNLFWTEEGFRFSWRVMLVEKAGNATFYIKNPVTGREGIVDNQEFLNIHQIKQMSFQPDMILEFAHYLASHYEKQYGVKPHVRAEVYVTMNGSSSRLLIDPTVNLANEEESLKPKKWILPFEEE